MNSSYAEEAGLLQLAKQAGNDYFSLYGAFPEKIGIHTDHLRYMRTYEIPFVHMPRALPLATLDTNIYPSLQITRTFCKIVPIYGLPANDVYVQLPGLPGLKPGEALHRMASSEYHEKYKRCK